jgi:hypothetical protein
MTSTLLAGGIGRGGFKRPGRGSRIKSFIDRRREEEEKREKIRNTFSSMERALREWERFEGLNPDHYRKAAKRLELDEKVTEAIVKEVEKFNDMDKLKYQEVQKRFTSLADMANKAREAQKWDHFEKVVGQIGILYKASMTDRAQRYLLFQRKVLSLITPLTVRKKWPASLLCAKALSNFRKITFTEEQEKAAYERCDKKQLAISKAVTFDAQNLLQQDIENMIRMEIMTDEQRKQLLASLDRGRPERPEGGEGDKPAPDNAKGLFGDEPIGDVGGNKTDPATKTDTDPKTGEKKSNAGGWE